MTENVTVDSSKIEWRRVAGEIVILDRAEQRYLALNASATALWPHIVHGCSRTELHRVLADEYGLPQSGIETQIDRFLRDLEARGLVEISRQEP